MKTDELLLKMIDYSKGNVHDINHFIKVYTYAHIIAKGENLDSQTVEIIDVAAIIHDIACPLCREKYGHTNGKYQEQEGEILAEEFLKQFDYSKDFINRVVYLVGHHHTLNQIEGIDYQILIEADYIVNAEESHYSIQNISNMFERVFKTKTGKYILKSVYLQ